MNFAHTNPLTQHGAYEGGFPFNGGPGGVGGHHATSYKRENDNKGQQIIQLVMQPPPPPDLGKKSQACNERAQYTSDVAETEEFIMKDKFITFP